MGRVHVVWDDAAIAMLPTTDIQARDAAARVAAQCEAYMKHICNVSPPGPLHESGRLRDSIRRVRGANGDYVIGPTASYAGYVNNGTLPHLIVSHGPWPLRNRETGQVFGPVVHHPGYKGSHFVERTAAEVGRSIRP